MTVLQYDFKDKEMSSLKNLGDLYLENNSGKSSSWFSSLRPLLTQGKNLIESLHLEKKNSADGMIKSSGSTARICPGMKDLFERSVIVKSPCDIHVSVFGQDQMSVSYVDQDLIKIDVHPPEQFRSRSNGLFHNKINMKFMLPIVLKTKHPYVFLQPTYHNDHPFEVLPGMVSEKFSRRIDLNINTMVDCTDEHAFMIKKGDALCYITFFERVKLQKIIDKERTFTTKYFDPENNYETF